MKKSSFQKNHDDFEMWLYIYADLIDGILRAKRVIRDKNDKFELVEALMLRIASLWDMLVEEDLIDALNKDPSKYAEELQLRLRKQYSRDECEALLVGTRYLDFKSVEQVQDFAGRYLVDEHNAFRLIPADSRTLINEFTVTMRNYLTHYSSFTRRAYERLMKKKCRFKNIRQPADFLVARSRQSGNRRLDDYLDAFFTASEEMRKIGS